MKTKSTKFSNDVSDLTKLPTYHAGVAQSSAYRMLMKLTDGAVKQYGITSMQWFMIGSIYDAGNSGVTITQLSKVLDTNVPYITNTVNVLVSKNIIARSLHSDDSRSKVVTIHPDFYDQVKLIENELRIKLQKILYADITPQELLAYVKVLYKINKVTLSEDD